MPVARNASKPFTLWTGPSGSGKNGGVTQSMLGSFLVCRERFRIRYVEGLQPIDVFNHRLEFGNMWHVCEATFAESRAGESKDQWLASITSYATKLALRYKEAGQQIEHCFQSVKATFPIYEMYWEKHPDVIDRTPLLQEQPFDVPYRLPSGRTVRLRGKWDGVDLVGKGKGAGIYLFETKTKSEIKDAQLKRQLYFDLQTMMYLVALGEEMTPRVERKEMFGPEEFNDRPLLGVRYNVVRRPGGGGKGNIKIHKDENPGQFYRRMQSTIYNSPSEYFARWKVEVTPQDVTKFRRQFLDPILEQMCDWWDWVTIHTDPFHPYESSDNQASPHWRMPYGVWNPITEGAVTDLDHYLYDGSTAGLERKSVVFPELEGE